MNNEKITKSHLYARVAMILFGLFLLAVALFLFSVKSNRVAFQMLGASFLGFSFAATPGIMFQRVGSRQRIQFSKISKVLAVIGALMIIISLVYHFIGGT